MIKPSDATKTFVDYHFKKAEKAEKEKKIYVSTEDFLNSIHDYWARYFTSFDKLETWQKIKPKENEIYKKWEEYMNKPTTPIKIFYSQPMHDKTEDEIKDKMDRLDNYIYGILMYRGFKQEDILRIEIIDNLHHEGLDPDAGRLKHLGASIQLMEDADLVIFDEKYFMAKGCCVEETVCKEYQLRYIYITDKDDENTFETDLVSWFERFLEKENVSK